MNQQAIIYVWKLRASWDKKLQNIFFNAVVIPNLRDFGKRKGGKNECLRFG